MLVLLCLYSFGMNYSDFLDTLQFIAERRLGQIDNENNITATAANITTTTTDLSNTITTATSSSIVLFNHYTLNDYHIRHDLQCIRQVLEDMLLDKLICSNNANHTNTNNRELYRHCQRLMEQTENIF